MEDPNSTSISAVLLSLLTFLFTSLRIIASGNSLKNIPSKASQVSHKKKNYSLAIYNETVQKIRAEIKLASIEKTTEKRGRLVGDIIIGL